jgi:hypothetical protein
MGPIGFLEENILTVLAAEHGMVYSPGKMYMLFTPHSFKLPLQMNMSSLTSHLFEQYETADRYDLTSQSNPEIVDQCVTMVYP